MKGSLIPSNNREPLSHILTSCVNITFHLQQPHGQNSENACKRQMLYNSATLSNVLQHITAKWHHWTLPETLACSAPSESINLSPPTTNMLHTCLLEYTSGCWNTCGCQEARRGGQAVVHTAAAMLQWISDGRVLPKVLTVQRRPQPQTQQVQRLPPCAAPHINRVDSTSSLVTT